MKGASRSPSERSLVTSFYCVWTQNSVSWNQEDSFKPLAPRAHDKKLELTFEVHPDVPDRLIGDVGRIRQILINLVGNSIKFTPRGEIVVCVVPGEKSTVGFAIRLTVSDTGIGIPPERLRMIFEPFTQADNSTTRRFGGTGLGLTICSRLSTLMGGRLYVESQAGQGSTFFFEVTLKRGSLAPSISLSKKLVKLQGLRILAVDDNATNRRVLEQMLLQWDMKPTVVEGGEEALSELQRAASNGQPYPVLLVDALMPEMNGFELVEQIRLRPDLAGSAIMMLSSADRRGEAERCRQLGMASYLLKPIKASDLQAAITAIVSTVPPTNKTVQVHSSPDRCRTTQTGIPTGQSLRILVAEDNAINQRVITGLLNKLGHLATLVGTGKQALEALERQEFDVVLMDVQMPEMDGYEATRAIRARDAEQNRHTPIIAMTAHAMKGDREQCLEVGMDDYVSKPIQPKDLQRALQVILIDAVPNA